MFGIFRKKKADKKDIPALVAGELDGKIQKLKLGCTKYLESKTRNWSPAKWKVALFWFCFISVGASIYVIITSWNWNSKTSPVKLSGVNITPVQLWKNRPAESANFFITEPEYRRLLEIDHYLDSLAHSATGKSLYDSILILKPGLPDSIRMLEQLYLNHRK